MVQHPLATRFSNGGAKKLRVYGFDRVNQQATGPLREVDVRVRVETCIGTDTPQIDVYRDVAFGIEFHAQMIERMGLTGSAPPVDDLMIDCAKTEGDLWNLNERFRKSFRIIHFSASSYSRQQLVEVTVHGHALLAPTFRSWGPRRYLTGW
jgi:hypothetical protein